MSVDGRISNIQVETEAFDVSTFGGISRSVAGNTEVTLTIKLYNPTREQLDSIRGYDLVTVGAKDFSATEHQQPLSPPRAFASKFDHPDANSW